MASDATITAALRAAEKAMDEWTDGSPIPGMWNKEGSAAAIAAFLRALPDVGIACIDATRAPSCF